MLESSVSVRNVEHVKSGNDEHAMKSDYWKLLRERHTRLEKLSALVELMFSRLWKSLVNWNDTEKYSITECLCPNQLREMNGNCTLELWDNTKRQSCLEPVSKENTPAVCVIYWLMMASRALLLRLRATKVAKDLTTKRRIDTRGIGQCNPPPPWSPSSNISK